MTPGLQESDLTPRKADESCSPRTIRINSSRLSLASVQCTGISSQFPCPSAVNQSQTQDLETERLSQSLAQQGIGRAAKTWLEIGSLIQRSLLSQDRGRGYQRTKQKGGRKEAKRSVAIRSILACVPDAALQKPNALSCSDEDTEDTDMTWTILCHSETVM